MTEVAQTTKEVIEVVTTSLQPLADKLGTNGQYIWGLQVKQAYVDGSIALVGLLFGLAIVVLTVFLNLKYYNDDEYYDFNFWVIVSIIPIIIGVSFIYSTIVTVFTSFINPEYYALQQLIKLVK